MSKLIKYNSEEDRIITETMKEFHEKTGLSVDIKLKSYMHRMLALYKGVLNHQLLEENLKGISMPAALTVADTEDLKKELERRGFQARNLWTVDDFLTKFPESDKEYAIDVLEKALLNEATMDQIWYAIEVEGEGLGLVLKRDLEEEEEHDFDSWNAAELFAFAKNMHIIDPDEEIENWDRADLLDVCRNYDPNEAPDEP